MLQTIFGDYVLPEPQTDRCFSKFTHELTSMENSGNCDDFP
jgi:hypothetical protein